MNTFTIAETDSLTTIAMYSPSEGGPAVHFARAMLGLEINDPKLVLRSALPQNSNELTEQGIAADLKHDILSNETDKLLYIMVSDLTGKNICKIAPWEKLGNIITTEGVYLLKKQYKSGRVTNEKLFITKK